MIFLVVQRFVETVMQFFKLWAVFRGEREQPAVSRVKHGDRQVRNAIQFAFRKFAGLN